MPASMHSGRRRHEMRAVANLVGVSALIMLVSGCAAVGPDYETPEAAVSQQWIDIDAPGVNNQSADFAQWWTAFNDPVLDSLVESPLTFADLNLENIVLEGAGASREQFVIVDGLGDRTWIPTQRWVKWERQRKKKEFRAKVHRYLKETGYDQPI